VTEKYSYPETTSSGGFICQNCGAFVSNDESHTCVRKPSNTGGDFDGLAVTYHWPTNNERIANTLERIAAALEKMT